MMRGPLTGWTPLRAAVLVALGLAAILTGPAGACTTALPPRPVADYRAASIVVVGVLEQSDPNLVVRVETRYRGPATARIVLRPGDFITWCPYPLGVPEVGERVLLAVVDPVDWQWPNGAAWALDARGRIRDAQTPWTGAPVPRTLAQALETMGIPPDTAALGMPVAATGKAVPTPVPVPALLAGFAAFLLVLGRFGRGSRGRAERQARLRRLP